ncbi:MAG: cytochrome c biogenesis protein CcsA [Candidatus Dormibacteraceae bacterium]
MTERGDRLLYGLAALGVAGLLAAGFVIAFETPVDAIQGLPQKIFYLHVSSFGAGYACLTVAVAGSVLYLWKGADRWDRWARAGAVPGLVLCTCCLAMGIVWAVPAWNWNPAESWDATFTMTVVLIAVYVAYFLVRQFAPAGRRARRLAAVVAIFGYIDGPVIYFSVDWWQTLHPGNVIQNDALPVSMLVTYLVTQLATLFLALVIVVMRYRVEARADEAAEARDQQLDAEPEPARRVTL